MNFTIQSWPREYESDFANQLELITSQNLGLSLQETDKTHPTFEGWFDFFFFFEKKEFLPEIMIVHVPRRVCGHSFLKETLVGKESLGTSDLR